jgi:hypothetical protein
MLTAVFIPAAKGAQEPLQTKKGADMKRNLVRGLVVSLFAVALCATAKSQELDHLVVNIPYDFVVNGKSLPAGKYDVKRLDDSDVQVLSISSLENRVNVVILPNSIDNPTEFRPAITFLQTGDQRILTKIQTDEHVFTLSVSGNSAVAKSKPASYVTGTSESR